MSKGPKTKAKAKANTKAKTKVKAKAKARVSAKVPEPKPDSSKAVPPTPPEAVQAAAAKPRGSLAAVSVVLFLTVIGASGYMTWYYWSALVGPNSSAKKATSVSPAPTPASPGPMEKMAAESKMLRQSLDRLMARMVSIEQSVEKAKRLAEATPPPTEKFSADPVLETLAGRLNTLEESGDTLKALTKRLDRMEKDNAAKAMDLAKETADDAQPAPAISGKDETSPVVELETDSIATAKAVALAVADLRQAITSPAPFKESLDALKALAGDNPDLNTGIVVLAKGAQTGIPTLVVLIDRFEGLAGKIVQVSRTVKETGWFDRATNRLSSLVTWRRVDGKGEVTSIDAMVAAAEDHLKKADLKAAIIALDGLSGNAKAAAVAAPWISDAKARLAAERAVTSLHLHALSMLTQIKPVKG